MKDRYYNVVLYDAESEMEHGIPGESGMDGSSECELDMAVGKTEHIEHTVQ